MSATKATARKKKSKSSTSAVKRGKRSNTPKAKRDDSVESAEPTTREPKRISALDAAAQVLTAEAKPMRPKEMIEQMAAQGLWTSPGGKTPEATLSAAIIREIAAKGNDARFSKHGRGVFIARS